jgi:mono/diheme cytochrome c family protein
MRLVKVALALLVVGGVVGVLVYMRPNIPPAERGRRLAEREGCFGCHGAEGTHGTPNPGRTDKTVPNYVGDVMMFANSKEEIREWIRDGFTASRAKSQTWRDQRERGILKMPAYKDRLTAAQIENLVAFVASQASIDSPEDTLAARGAARAEELGCFGCHGSGGRLARPNPGSLKGYVPSWDGADFPELVANRDEFEDWVNDGVADRFEKNPAASFFLKRAVLKMPAFHAHLEPGDVDALWAYVQWLRSPAGAR